MVVTSARLGQPREAALTTAVRIGTALHLALLRGQHDIVDVLQAAGAPEGQNFPSVSHLLASANVERGELLAGGCKLCHHLENGQPDEAKSGPPLWGVIGRKVGSVKGFDYTPALKSIDGVWDYDSINSYIRSPWLSVPGTRMEYFGIEADQDRADIVAFLRTQSHDPVPLP